MIFKDKKNKTINNIINKTSSIKNFIINNMYKEIISISDNINNSITKIFKDNSKKLIEKKTSINDGLIFHLKNAICNSTHEKTTSYLNINKQSNISRQAYENRSDLFNYEQLKIINDNLYSNNSYKNNFNINDNNEAINFIDGTNINIYDKNSVNGYKNINILGLTNNNNNGFLFTNDINNIKQSESKLFYKLLNVNSFEKNDIIVVDRYYFSKKFIKSCNQKKIKFIARIKSNSNVVDKFNIYLEDQQKKINNNQFDYKCKYYDNNIRIITFKSNNDYVHIATNIFNKKKDINYFKNKYGNRWNVEIYFKHIKKNSSINKITSHKLKTINNIILSSSINQIIIDRIISVYNKFNKDKEKKIDITNFYNLYSEKLLYKIINKSLSEEEFTNLIILSISFYKKKIKKEKSTIRYAIMPYYKWHYKFISNLNKKVEEKID